jgi:hypothetical protein
MVQARTVFIVEQWNGWSVVREAKPEPEFVSQKFREVETKGGIMDGARGIEQDRWSSAK